jgi:predicted amino acid dehydrogenase
MVIEQDDQMNFEPFTAQNQGVSEVAAHCVRKSFQQIGWQLGQSVLYYMYSLS